jgi:hypothetical protein
MYSLIGVMAIEKLAPSPMCVAEYVFPNGKQSFPSQALEEMRPTSFRDPPHSKSRKWNWIACDRPNHPDCVAVGEGEGVKDGVGVNVAPSGEGVAVNVGV